MKGKGRVEERKKRIHSLWKCLVKQSCLVDSLNFAGAVLRGINLGRRNKCIIFSDDMALLAEDERMLKSMLMELNERCEDYGMKINISKTKVMVIGRK